MKTIVGLVACAMVIGFVGCADRPFVRADPPVTSDGIIMSLVGQKCGREAWYENYDVLNLEMVVRVTNRTSSPVDIVPSQMRLLARGNSFVPRSSRPEWEDAPLELQPNASTDVRVNFQRWGNAKCDEEMQLSPGRSMEISGKDVTLPPLAFAATRTDA
jgi:hypothetical protein